ncbi:MAG: hypothetical protein WDM78_17115 [Puia sp.]
MSPPLLKIKKIDFALVFAVNETQLRGIIHEVLPALGKGGKFWVAYPKTSSKIATTLNGNAAGPVLRTQVLKASMRSLWTMYGRLRALKKRRLPVLLC